MTDLRPAGEAYRDAVVLLANSGTTTEESYYGAIRDLLANVLQQLSLPSDVRTGTSEPRAGGGTDRPDVALYDAGGDFVVVCGEVKLPEETIEELARSTDRNDQIGRYLAQTGAILLSNVRGFGLLVADDAWEQDGPVPPDHRRLLQTVAFWPDVTSMEAGYAISQASLRALSDMVEEAVTGFAPIASPETLARVLALQARRAKENLPGSFGQAVQALIDDFGEALGITFEGAEGEAFFRSSLVQTVFYGLFAGWLLWAEKATGEPFDWRNIPDYLTIPFLGDLFFELQHPRRLAELGLAPRLDLATATLGRVDQARFFGSLAIPTLGGSEGDPERAAASAIVYFYEPFLAAFDPDLRKELGVWYTPPEIVQYQIRKVDRLLRDELDCRRGLADDRVVVLDPACGTGAYLIEVLACMAKQLRSEGVQAELGATLLRAVENRVLGFEILTAPFVIAHLQLHLILSGLGAEPDPEHRPGVYLTNSLTGWGEEEAPELHFPELATEHDLAHQVKSEAKIIVVVGNPPYNRFAGAPVEEERDLADHYKGITRDSEGRQDGATALYTRFGIRKHLLDDLYIRFFRLAEIRIGRQADYGIVSLISNSSYLAGRSHPVMRESLIGNFDRIWIDNLNGDKYKTGKVIPDGEPGAGSSDESIFVGPSNPGGIQVGVAITTLLKKAERSDTPPELYFRDFWGAAESKRRALIEALSLSERPEEWVDEAAQKPEGPRAYEVFETSERQHWRLVPYTSVGGYEDWYSLEDIFPFSLQGINPNRGMLGSVVDTRRGELATRMREYFDDDVSFETLQRHYPELCAPRARYHPKATRSLLRQQEGFQDGKLVPYVMFPLDRWYLYYETGQKLLNESRPDLKANLRPDNCFLLAVPQPRRQSESIPLYAAGAFDLHVHDRGTVGFPAVVYHTSSSQSDMFATSAISGPHANLAPAIWEEAQQRWDLRGDLAGPAARILAHELIAVCLALGHAPLCQEEHSESLAQDWARLPIPADRDLFGECVEAGSQIMHLLDPTSEARGLLEELVGPEPLAQLGVLRSVDGSPLREEDLVVRISYYGSARGRWEERPWADEEDRRSGWGETTGDLYLNDNVFLKNVPRAVWKMELGGYPVIAKWLGYRGPRFRDQEPLSLVEKDTLRELVQRLSGIVALHPRLDDLYNRASGRPWTTEAPDALDS